MADFFYLSPTKKIIKLEGVIISKIFLENENTRKILLSDDSFNFLNSKNEIISKSENFLKAQDFKNDCAIVQRENEKYNFLKKDGTFLCKEDFEKVWDFEGEIARVKFDNYSFNFIDRSGNIIFKDENFYHAWEAHCKFYAVQRRNGKFNFISTNGTVLSKEDFSSITSFSNGFAKVTKKDSTLAIIDEHGNFVS